ncbi:MAG: hypothetical protein JSW20_09420 [Nitrospiraceae bacterium]|nr:MAG: hypothetical protein JSW20_09420 [Nitrospiraceae bacterium]
MQKAKLSKKEQESDTYRNLPVFEDRRIDSVKRNFAIGIDRVGTSMTLSNGSSRSRKQLNRN